MKDKLIAQVAQLREDIHQNYGMADAAFGVGARLDGLAYEQAAEVQERELEEVKRQLEAL